MDPAHPLPHSSRPTVRPVRGLYAYHPLLGDFIDPIHIQDLFGTFVPGEVNLHAQPPSPALLDHNHHSPMALRRHSLHSTVDLGEHHCVQHVFSILPKIAHVNP